MKNGYTIFDAHAHVFPNKIAERATSSISVFYDDMPMQHIGSMEQLLKSGANAGIDGYLICSTATNVAQVQAINQFLWDSCKDHVNCIAFAAMHPFAPDCQADMDFILQHGFRGIKLHPDFQKFHIDDDRMIAVYREANRRGLPVLFHTGDSRTDFSSPRRLMNVVEKIPDFTCIAAHLGGYSEWEAARRDLKGTNVYIDTSSSLFVVTREQALENIAHFGVERTMFGTDFPMWLPKTELERFFALGLSEEENRKILYGNFARLFHLEEQV